MCRPSREVHLKAVSVCRASVESFVFFISRKSSFKQVFQGPVFLLPLRKCLHFAFFFFSSANPLFHSWILFFFLKERKKKPKRQASKQGSFTNFNEDIHKISFRCSGWKSPLFRPLFVNCMFFSFSKTKLAFSSSIQESKKKSTSGELGLANEKTEWQCDGGWERKKREIYFFQKVSSSNSPNSFFPPPLPPTSFSSCFFPSRQTFLFSLSSFF